MPPGAVLAAAGRAVEFFLAAVFGGALDFLAAVPTGGVAVEVVLAMEPEQMNVKRARVE